jgi:hypothetical protein
MLPGRDSLRRDQVTGQLHITHRADYLRGREAGKADAANPGARYQRLPTATDPERAYAQGYADGWMMEITP